MRAPAPTQLLRRRAGVPCRRTCLGRPVASAGMRALEFLKKLRVRKVASQTCVQSMFPDILTGVLCYFHPASGVCVWAIWAYSFEVVGLGARISSADKAHGICPTHKTCQPQPVFHSRIPPQDHALRLGGSRGALRLPQTARRLWHRRSLHLRECEAGSPFSYPPWGQATCWRVFFRVSEFPCSLLRPARPQVYNLVDGGQTTFYIVAST